MFLRRSLWKTNFDWNKKSVRLFLHPSMLVVYFDQWKLKQVFSYFSVTNGKKERKAAQKQAKTCNKRALVNQGAFRLFNAGWHPKAGGLIVKILGIIQQIMENRNRHTRGPAQLKTSNLLHIIDDVVVLKIDKFLLDSYFFS